MNMYWSVWIARNRQPLLIARAVERIQMPEVFVVVWVTHSV